MVNKIVDGVKYIGLVHKNELKSLSLEDKVYFTLNDIWHASTDVYNYEVYDFPFDTAFKFMNVLVVDLKQTNKVYTNVLHNPSSQIVLDLYKWLCIIMLEYDKRLFEFSKINEIEDDEYDKFYVREDVWWDQLKELVETLKLILTIRGINVDEIKVNDIDISYLNNQVC